MKRRATAKVSVRVRGGRVGTGWVLLALLAVLACVGAGFLVLGCSIGCSIWNPGACPADNADTTGAGGANVCAGFGGDDGTGGAGGDDEGGGGGDGAGGAGVGDSSTAS